MGEDFRKQLRELRPRFEKPKEVHSARQALNDIAEPVERMVRGSTRCDRWEKRWEHRLERLTGGEGSERPRFPGPPVEYMPRGALGIAEAEGGQLVLEDVGVVREDVALVGRKAVEDPSRRFSMGTN